MGRRLEMSINGGSHNYLKSGAFYLLFLTLPLLFTPLGRVYLPTGNKLAFPVLFSLFFLYLIILNFLYKGKIIHSQVFIPLLLIGIGYLFGIVITGPDLRSIEVLLKLFFLMILGLTIQFLAPSFSALKRGILYLMIILSILTIIQLYNVWLLDQFQAVNLMRGLRGHNATVFVFLTIIPFSISGIIYTNKLKSQLFYFALSLILISGLISTYSRGGLLALILGLITSIFILQRKKYSNPVLRRVLIIIIILGIMSVFLFPSSLTDRIKSTFDITEQEYKSSNLDRLILLKTGFRMIYEHPIVGIGLEKFNDEFPKYVKSSEVLILEKSTYSHSHNQYVDIWNGSGLIGFIGFVLLLFIIFKYLRLSLEKEANNKPDMNFLIMGCVILWSVYVWIFLFQRPFFLEIFWVGVGITLANLRLSFKKERPSNKKYYHNI